MNSVPGLHLISDLTHLSVPRPSRVTASSRVPGAAGGPTSLCTYIKDAMGEGTGGVQRDTAC